jgi:NADPH2:quinone reductase
MKAILIREFGAPAVMKLEEVPPPAAGPGQVVVRVKAAGVNPVDTYVRSGAYARKPALPHTPGFDIAGIIESVGSGVTRVKVGDRVYGFLVSGGYAELVACDESHVRPLPDTVSFEQGAALGTPYTTAWIALFSRLHARPGETALVHGASGGVGVAAVQIARAHGLRVIGTAGTEQGLRAIREDGAHVALNHHTAGYLDSLNQAGGAGAPDVVVEMLANVNLDRDLDVIAPRGRIVIVGNRGRGEIDARKAMGKDATISGVMLFNATPAELNEAQAGLIAGLENGSLKPRIGQRLPLADAAQAHEAVMSPGAMGKIVLIP